MGSFRTSPLNSRLFPVRRLPASRSIWDGSFRMLGKVNTLRNQAVCAQFKLTPDEITLIAAGRESA
jgi:hypothetical protein